jgi:acetyl-CoA carboxylase biotin carboxyl carrier protein
MSQLAGCDWICEAAIEDLAIKREPTPRHSIAGRNDRTGSKIENKRIGDDTMSEEVRAPLAGNVIDVLVAVGAKVDVDDELLVIEAMKMQNVVYSHAAGIVREVRVQKGGKVESDAVLLVIE